MAWPSSTAACSSAFLRPNPRRKNETLSSMMAAKNERSETETSSRWTTSSRDNGSEKIEAWSVNCADNKKKKKKKPKKKFFKNKCFKIRNQKSEIRNNTQIQNSKS